MAMNLSLHFADVVDNEDEDEKGKIQIRVLPEMKDFEDDKLPWVRPFINRGMNENEYSQYLPQVGSKLWVVFIDKYYKEGYYLTGAFIDGFFDFDAIDQELDNIDELSNKDYKNLGFTQLPDGTIIFYNTDTGEMGVYHSSGKYVVIDNEGAITISADTNFIGDMSMDGDMEVTGNLDVGDASEPLTLFTSLQSALNTLLGALATHLHVDPLTGSTGPPQPPLTTYTSGSTIGLDSAQSQNSNSD